jgi:hypothetical protein
LCRPFGEIIIDASRPAFVVGFHLPEAVNCVGILVVIDNVVMPPAHEDQVVETAALDGALLSVIASAAGRAPLMWQILATTVSPAISAAGQPGKAQGLLESANNRFLAGTLGSARSRLLVTENLLWWHVLSSTCCVGSRFAQVAL